METMLRYDQSLSSITPLKLVPFESYVSSELRIWYATAALYEISCWCLHRSVSAFSFHIRVSLAFWHSLLTWRVGIFMDVFANRGSISQIFLQSFHRSFLQTFSITIYCWVCKVCNYFCLSRSFIPLLFSLRVILIPRVVKWRNLCSLVSTYDVAETTWRQFVSSRSIIVHAHMLTGGLSCVVLVPPFCSLSRSGLSISHSWSPCFLPISSVLLLLGPINLQLTFLSFIC